jgi:hypothetical protein
MSADARDALRRALSDALSALQADTGVVGLEGLADRLMALGPAYRLHGVRLRQSIRQQDHSAIIADVIQVLDKLERGVT